MWEVRFYFRRPCHENEGSICDIKASMNIQTLPRTFLLFESSFKLFCPSPHVEVDCSQSLSFVIQVLLRFAWSPPVLNRFKLLLKTAGWLCVRKDQQCRSGVGKLRPARAFYVARRAATRTYVVWVYVKGILSIWVHFSRFYSVHVYYSVLVK